MLASCKPQPNWIPMKPKLMLKICQKLKRGLFIYQSSSSCAFHKQPIRSFAASPFGARQVSDLPTNLYPFSWVSDPSVRKVADLLYFVEGFGKSETCRAQEFSNRALYLA